LIQCYIYISNSTV